METLRAGPGNSRSGRGEAAGERRNTEAIWTKPLQRFGILMAASLRVGDHRNKGAKNQPQSRSEIAF
jgi:hypothetical protein